MGEANGRGTLEQRRAMAEQDTAARGEADRALQAVAARTVYLPGQPGLPRCQYCGAHPMPLIPVFVSLSGAKAIVGMCAGCGASHPVQILEVSKPQAPMIIPAAGGF